MIVVYIERESSYEFDVTVVSGVEGKLKMIQASIISITAPSTQTKSDCASIGL